MVGRLIGVVLFSLIWSLGEWVLISRIDFPVVSKKRHKDIATKNKQNFFFPNIIIFRVITVIYCLVSIATVTIIGILSSEIIFIISFIAVIVIHALYFGILTILERKY